VKPPGLLEARCPPELRAAKRQALLGVARLTEAAENFPSRAESEIRRRVLSLEELIRNELERLTPATEPRLPSHLRLVIDNTVPS
jgi:hypothetical protein